MKNFFLITLVLLMAFNACEKEETPDHPQIVILEKTCAGDVIRFLKPDDFGESWKNIFETERTSYTNCALAESIPSEFKKGDTLDIEYVEVSRFTTAGLCTLDSLPKTKIRIQGIYTNGN